MDSKQKSILLIVSISISFAVMLLISFSSYDHMNRSSDFRKELLLMSRTWFELRSRVADITTAADNIEAAHAAIEESNEFSKIINNTSSVIKQPRYSIGFTELRSKLSRLQNRWANISQNILEIQNLLRQDLEYPHEGKLQNALYLTKEFHTDTGVFESWILEILEWIDDYSNRQMRTIEFLFFAFTGILIAISTLMLHTSIGFQTKERLYYTAINSVGEGCIIADNSSRIIFANDKAAKLLEQPSADSLQNVHINQILEPGTAPGGISFTMKQHETVIGIESHDMGEGTDEPVGTLFLLKDLTALAEIQDEIAKTAELERLGNTVSGIAHKLNNMLMTVLGNIELASLSCDPAGNEATLLAESKQAVLKSKELAHRLLSCSDRDGDLHETIAIGDLIEEAVRFIPRQGKLKLVLPPAELMRASHIEADRKKVREALEAVLRNAVESMRWEGVITVSLIKEQLRPGKKLNYRIGIRDEGHGIAPENISRIFDPFFTTKPGARGIGLSLASSYIRQSGGTLCITSSAELGTTAEVTFPSVPGLEDEEEFLYETAQREFRVLIVDDEKSIREVGEKMILQLGCAVETAESGEEAVTILRNAVQERNRFDALILDLSIPGGMDGLETMKEIRKIDSEVRVFLSTGYTNSPALSNYEELGFNDILPKPYEFSKLKAVLLRHLNIPRSKRTSLSPG